MLNIFTIITQTQYISIEIYLLDRLQEKHTREVMRDHLKNVTVAQTDLKRVHQQLMDIQHKIKQSYQRQQQLLAAHSSKLVYLLCNQLLFIYQIIHPFIRLYIHLSNHSSIYKIIYPFIKSFIHL